MISEERIKLVAPCGYCCLSCAAYEHSVCNDEVAIQREATRANLPIEKLRGVCAGCRQMQGAPHRNMLCKTYDCCVNEKCLNFCFQCEDFPCLKLAPISDRADVRRHNTKIYNLLMLRKLDLEEYIQRSSDLLTQWARGKTPIPGDDVQIQENV